MNGTPSGATELPGTYVADYGFATDTLTLSKDGSFTQEVTVRATGKKFASRGTWWFDAKPRDVYLQKGFRAVVDYAGQLKPNLDQPDNIGAGVLRARRTAWALELGGDDIPWNRGPAETPYTKQSSRPRK